MEHSACRSCLPSRPLASRLSAPRYIVYDPAQVRLAYLFEVNKSDRPSESNSNAN